MRFAKISVAAVLLFAAAAASATGSGTIVINGRTTLLKDACAYTHPDTWEKTKTATTIVLSDKPIDAARINAASDREKELRALFGEQGATTVELNIDADGSVQNVNTAQPVGANTSQSGSGWYTLDFARKDAKRIEGSFRSTDENEKKDLQTGRYYDLKFAVDLPAAPDRGAATQSDEDGLAKVYRAYLAALIAEGSTALRKQ